MRVRGVASVVVVGALLSIAPTVSSAVHPTFLLGGRTGDARTLSLDAKGRTLRAAEGDGSTSALSVCPGSEVFAELATGVENGEWWHMAVAVRDVDTLALRHEHRFTSFVAKDGPRSIAPVEIECLDPDGGSIAVFGRRGNATSSIARIRGDDEDVIFRGPVGGVELEGGYAFVAQNTALRELDLRTGRMRHVGTISPGTMSIDVSPDRKHVVFSATGAGDVTKAGHFVLDVDGRRVERLRTRLSGYSWVDDETFVVFGRDELVRIIDTRLRKVAQWTGWGEQDGIVRNNVVYAAGREAVVSAPVRTGPVKTLRLFGSAQSFAFEVVPPRPPRPATPAPKRADAPQQAVPVAASAAPADPDPPTLVPQLAADGSPSSSRRSSTAASGAVAVGIAVLAGIALMRGRRPAR